MDLVVFHWFNQFNGKYELLNDAIRFAQVSHIKALPFMAVVWLLWFLPSNAAARTQIREKLLAALLCTIPIILITRVLADRLPMSLRPIHTPGLDMNDMGGEFRGVLDGWSSMPSDHASLFIGFAVAILTVNRRFGLLLLVWAVFVVAIPRIVVGLHWPSDIVVGALIGSLCALVLMKPLTALLRRIGIIPFFETREAIGYPLLFFFTYEITTLFELSRYLMKAVAS
ncbi:MAG: phosphatase PAP2 family protein [Yoonia sp.]|uniref:phosphatase PAP2 family protein n=1 Tax=Yoonia sp. TaxID=2212373 RepID=UPI00273F843D|nr:phosphatase PAP2 family protein [Yoonia sp.]MDP5084819.1 phosphatase PAP2 family protein [Yoonia sp.]